MIIPPLCEPTVPLLGPFQMAGFAKRHDFGLDVLDLNAAFVRTIVDSAKAPFEAESVKPELLLEMEACRRFLDSYEINQYSDLIRKLRVCRSTSEYWALIDYVRASYDLFSLRFSGCRFRFDGFETGYRWNVWSDVERFVKDYVASPLFEQVREWVVAYHLGEDERRAVGINITFESQLFFAILLCIAVREHNPKSFISIGGAFVNAFIHSADSIGPLGQYCDLVTSGEGEALIWRLLQEENWKSIQMLGEFSGKRAYYIDAPSLCQIHLDAYPPAFDSVDLSTYLSPAKVIPLRFTEECYWGNCKFCAEGKRHGPLKLQYDFDEITRFCIEGCRSGLFEAVYFLDSAIPFRILDRFADSLIASSVSMRWGTNVRADFPFTNEAFIRKLAAAGCVFVKFGLESGSQRELNLMNKGISIENAAKFVYLCRKYHITVHAYVMFAYPGETKQDRALTREFLMSDYSHPDNYNCSEFILYDNAPIALEIGHSFDDFSSENKWGHASYTFTNDAIKQEISEMREAFDRKFSPASVLASTGHTIVLSRGLRPSSPSVPLSLSARLRLSKCVVCGNLCGEFILGKWRRRDGFLYITGHVVGILSSLTSAQSVENILAYGITSNTLYALLEEEFLELSEQQPEKSGKQDSPLNRSGNLQVSFQYGNTFNKMRWYGYYDMD